MNGTLKELDVRELMRKVKERRCSIFTERTNKNDTYIISIHYEELFGEVNDETKYYIDIVKEDVMGDQSRITAYADHSNLTDKEVIKKLEAFINWVC